MADRFDWDEANISHIARHGVESYEIEQVFENDPEDEYTHTTDDGEDRYFAQGFTNAGRELGVAYTY